MNLPEKLERLSHAYIVTGGGEQSRKKLAARLAMAYVCREGESEKPCGRCRDCRKAQAGIHPDISILSPAEGKKEITVDQARALRSDAYVYPNEAARKVYLIDPADALNLSAQNTLLKVVEEGPPYAAFLLIAPQPGALLETLRSRCEPITLPPEDNETFAPAPARLEQAQELARLLEAGDELALAVFLAQLEGTAIKSTEVLDLYALTEEVLARRPRETAALLRRLSAFRVLRPYNVGPGHLLGKLAGTSQFIIHNS